jgi:molecular chaperone GrpE
MNPNQESEELDEIVDDTGTDASVSVDDFIKQLEEKEKDLHINANTTIIEIEESFDGEELPDFMKGEFEFAPAKAGPAPEPAKAVVEKPPVVGKLEKEITDLKEQIVALEADRDEMKRSTLRRAKDFESYKSRTERERKESFRKQVGNLATQMLPALDNLNRAVDFAMAMPEKQRTEMQQFFDGIVLVNQQVNDVLAEMGVQPIATVGEIFDPHFHEAVATEESDEHEPETISAELLRGYRIGDHVIRHSMVRVVKAPPPADSFEEAPDEAEDASEPQSSDLDVTPEE